MKKKTIKKTSEIWRFVSPLLLTIPSIILGVLFGYEPIIVTLGCMILYEVQFGERR